MQSRQTTYVLLALLFGLCTGVLLNVCTLPESSVRLFLVDAILEPTGRVFVASLKMLVVPLVFTSLVCGVVGLEGVHKLGRMGLKTLVLYLLTTALGLTLAIGMAVVFQPGIGFDLPSVLSYQPRPSPSLMEVLVGMVPSNPVQAAAEGKMLQIIVFALLFGLGVLQIKAKVPVIVRFLEELNDVMMGMVSMLLRLAPVGVYALIAQVFADKGVQAFAPLLRYFLLVLFVLAIHAVTVYPMLLKLAGLDPWAFLRKAKSVAFFALSTASSSATIPVTLQTLDKSFGVPRSIASFTIPLGATINMDGTAIMQGVATLFIAQTYQISLGFTEYLTVIFTATLASVGAAGVPGVGLVTLAMVLRQVGLPVEGIAMILGVDRALDMVRTAVNVAG
ncbi:MAG: dicarboxylate/amino acid:cation symporter, partial [Zetaproteobacteria bacterium]|nr:dicarboxylate/amino acid:cation symporter [Zetaproteobacteria bacterium]